MLTAAILGAVISFGGYSSNLSNYPRFYDNTITCHCYYDINISENTGSNNYEVMHFHDVCRLVGDFEEQDDGIYLFVDSISVKTYEITNELLNNEVLIGSSYESNFYNGLQDGILLEPNGDYKYMKLTHQNYSFSSGILSFRTTFSFEDDTLDDNASNYAITSFYNDNSLYGSFRSNSYRVAMSDFYYSVRNAFALQGNGYEDGYGVGYTAGYNVGSDQGYNTGYSDGYTAGVSVDQTAFTIFNGILNIGMLPINVFLAMFNFDVFGINLSNFVMSLLTISVTIWVVKTISGGGGDDK